jgi:ribosomal protein S18 acetylase RimI-like enzyme
MSVSLVSQVGPNQQERVYATLVSAFTDDPVERWLYPDDEQYHRAFPPFLHAFGGRAFETGGVWQVEGGAAVALWLPPGNSADGDVIVEILTETVATEKHDDMFSVLEAMDASHPTEPHWYLPWLGVHVDHQGRGLGAQLLAHCLTVVDADGLPTFLETPNPRNIAFYERHGFEVTGHARSGTCPPITFMWRPAR